mgnify:CR=1 FL=1
MQTITRDEVQQKLSGNGNVALVDVLSEESFNEFHLPDAINVPLGNRFAQRIQEAVPDKSRPVIVYCKNTECNASPKAAQQMDELGYEEVYDYEAGKADWKAAGLEVET